MLLIDEQGLEMELNDATVIQEAHPVAWTVGSQQVARPRFVPARKVIGRSCIAKAKPC